MSKYWWYTKDLYYWHLPYYMKFVRHGICTTLNLYASNLFELTDQEKVCILWARIWVFDKIKICWFIFVWTMAITLFHHLFILYYYNLTMIVTIKIKTSQNPCMVLIIKNYNYSIKFAIGSTMYSMDPLLASFRHTI